MNILALDTSTQRLSLAVAQGQRVVRYRNRRLVRPLSSSIMPGINKILKDAGVPLKGIDGFAVGLGPGSFTSLRVGLSTVKGLAFVTGKPVVGISSLDIVALNAPAGAPQVCVLMDARRDMVYACLYVKKGEVLRRVSDYLLTDIKDVLRKVKGPTVFIGDGAALYREAIEGARPVKPIFAGPREGFPDARCLVDLALKKFQDGPTDDVDRLVPMYLYPDHCQVQRT
jgi:tRNA threonylcarbamoyladenosine biosynthesis protein TsaB